MAIKLRSDVKRTEVRPAFWAALAGIAEVAAVHKMGEIKRLSTPAAQQRKFKEEWPQLKIIKEAVARNEHLQTHIVHSGWEYVTGLSAFGQRWLEFGMSDVICRPTRRQNRNSAYNLGDYQVYVPEEAFVMGDIAHIRFVPAANPFQKAWHPHHTNERGANMDDVLSTKVYTCWGGYANWSRNALARWHIVDLMLGLKKFLTNYTPGDTLWRLHTGNFPNLRAAHE